MQHYERAYSPFMHEGLIDRSARQRVEAERPSVIVTDGAVVGRVLKVNDHPNGERIWLSHIEVGDSETLQIVFGGQYKVQPGELVPVAPPGAVVMTPSGRLTRMRIRRYRGERSQGMLCSLDELGWLEGGPDEVAVLLNLQPNDNLDELAADQRPRVVRDWQRAAESAARIKRRNALG